MSDIELKRDRVMGMYASPGWKAKVRKMSDAQVVAIFLREQNKAKQNNAVEKKDKPKESGTDDAPF